MAKYRKYSKEFQSIEEMLGSSDDNKHFVVQLQNIDQKIAVAVHLLVSSCCENFQKTIIHKLPVKEVRRRGSIPLEETESALQQIDLSKKPFNVIDRYHLYLQILTTYSERLLRVIGLKEFLAKMYHAQTEMKPFFGSTQS